MKFHSTWYPERVITKSLQPHWPVGTRGAWILFPKVDKYFFKFITSHGRLMVHTYSDFQFDDQITFMKTGNKIKISIQENQIY
jgi:hypothetical protein